MGGPGCDCGHEVDRHDGADCACEQLPVAELQFRAQIVADLCRLDKTRVVWFGGYEIDPRVIAQDILNGTAYGLAFVDACRKNPITDPTKSFIIISSLDQLKDAFGCFVAKAADAVRGMF